MSRRKALPSTPRHRKLSILQRSGTPITSQFWPLGSVASQLQELLSAVVGSLEVGSGQLCGRDFRPACLVDGLGRPRGVTQKQTSIIHETQDNTQKPMSLLRAQRTVQSAVTAPRKLAPPTKDHFKRVAGPVQVPSNGVRALTSQQHESAFTW